MLLTIVLFIILSAICLYENITLDECEKENDFLYNEKKASFTDDDYNFSYKFSR